MENIVIGIEGTVGAGKTSICRELLNEIDNSIISRLKVIRIYNLLTNYNNTLREEEKLSEEDIRLFAISHNAYIKTDTYEKIKTIAHEKRGRTKWNI